MVKQQPAIRLLCQMKQEMRVAWVDASVDWLVRDVLDEQSAVSTIAREGKENKVLLKRQADF